MPNYKNTEQRRGTDVSPENWITRQTGTVITKPCSEFYEGQQQHQQQQRRMLGKCSLSLAHVHIVGQIYEAEKVVFYRAARSWFITPRRWWNQHVLLSLSAYVYCPNCRQSFGEESAKGSEKPGILELISG